MPEPSAAKSSSPESPIATPQHPVWSVDDGMLVWRGADQWSDLAVGEFLSGEDDDRPSQADARALIDLVAAAGVIISRRCDIYVPPYTCITERATDTDGPCDPCRLHGGYFSATSGDG